MAQAIWSTNICWLHKIILFSDFVSTVILKWPKANQLRAISLALISLPRVFCPHPKRKKKSWNTKDNVKWQFPASVTKTVSICSKMREVLRITTDEKEQGERSLLQKVSRWNVYERFCSKHFKNDWCARIQWGICAEYVEMQIHLSNICIWSAREYSSQLLWWSFLV